MKNKKIILGLGTITALGAMSVGFIACVKKPEVEKIVGDKTKDLSKLKKDDLNDKFKTLEDKIGALEKQLKEATNKKDLDALLKQMLDVEIQKFEANVEKTFGKNLNEVKFKKERLFSEKKEENTGEKLFEKIKSNFRDFKDNFKIVNEDALKKQITEDKFKLKIVANGRSATNSPFFVKEIEIKFFDVLVEDIINLDVFKGDALKGFKNQEALKNKIKEITDSNETKASDIAKFEVSSINGTDATIKVTPKKGKTIDKDTFVIKGAIARTLVADHFTNFKPSNETSEDDIIKHLNKHPDFQENNLTDADLVITLPTDDEKATKDKTGKITIKAKDNSKRVQGEVELTIPKKEKLDIEKIKNNTEIQNIKYLNSLDDVKTKLNKINVVGVKEFEAKPEDNGVDVKVTIKPSSTHYLEHGSENFLILKDAIKKTIKSAEIEANPKIKKIKNSKDLGAVNKELEEIAKKIDGVTKLEAKLDGLSTTDVVVTITIDEAKYKLEGDKTFNIPGAIK